MRESQEFSIKLMKCTSKSAIRERERSLNVLRGLMLYSSSLLFTVSVFAVYLVCAYCIMSREMRLGV